MNFDALEFQQRGIPSLGTILGGAFMVLRPVELVKRIGSLRLYSTLATPQDVGVS
jgi:hypothetical protein